MLVVDSEEESPTVSGIKSTVFNGLSLAVLHWTNFKTLHDKMECSIPERTVDIRDERAK